jgi:hypothetical protein
MTTTWGLFSRCVPGRVGYQCSNFYRLLVQNGEISDPNYAFDASGKLRRIRNPKTDRAAPRPRRAGGRKGEQLSRYDLWAAQNPIPDVTDALTGETIRVPAISPDGYVLDYNSWVRTIANESVNPFTKIPVKKRDLVILTHENWDEYKDKIRNL